MFHAESRIIVKFLKPLESISWSNYWNPRSQNNTKLNILKYFSMIEMLTWYSVAEEWNKLPYSFPSVPLKSFSRCCIMFTKSPVYALFLPFQSWDSLILNLWGKRFKAECRAGSGAWNWNKTHRPDTNICIHQIFCTPRLTSVVEQKQTLIIGERGSWLP